MLVLIPVCILMVRRRVSAVSNHVARCCGSRAFILRDASLRDAPQDED